MSDLQGPLEPNAVNQMHAILGNLPTMPAGWYLDRIYLHWTVEGQGACDGSYNIDTPLIGSVFVARIATDPRLNATSPVQDGYAAHTYQRNSHAVGISVNGMDGPGVDASDFGSDPVQLHAVEVMCAAAAAVAEKYAIDTLGKTPGPAGLEWDILTHGEVAVIDGYPDERWDLGRLHPSPNPLTPAERSATGDLLRARIHQYKLALQ
jgi:hypothetical protein